MSACLAACDCHRSGQDSPRPPPEIGALDSTGPLTCERKTVIMGKLLVVGSVALDTVKTPFGEATEVLGGSATYFSTSASYFTAVDLIAVVGEDFPSQHLAFLKSRNIDLAGLERRSGATFRWRGEYTHQLNEAH